MILGYLLVSAVLVVVLGRLGDMFGRVRIYNLGFLRCASVALSVDPFRAGAGALWLIVWRIVQPSAGPCSPPTRRPSSPTPSPPTSAAWRSASTRSPRSPASSSASSRAVFWVSVPVSVTGTIWSYLSLRETAACRRGRIDWFGNVTFAAGAGILLAGITYDIQPYGGGATGWNNPWALAGLFGGVSLLMLFCIVETRVAEPMFQLSLFKVRAFAAGNLAALVSFDRDRAR